MKLFRRSILAFVSTPSLFELIDNRTQSLFVYIILILGLNFVISLVVYFILLYRSKTINNLYSVPKSNIKILFE